VVVAPFENQTGDSALAPLAHLTSDWITHGFAETGFAEVVDPETIRSAWQTAPNARNLAAATRARVVVSGAYYRVGDSVRLLARITDAAENRLLAVVPPVNAAAANLQQGLATLRERVLGAVGGLLDVSAATWAAASGLPPSLAAYERWSAGLEHYMRGEWREAIPALLAATRLDSTFVLPLLWAATAYKELGEYATADSLLRVVDKHPRERLTPIDRYLLQNVQAQLRGDWASALQAAREMARVAPASAVSLIVLGWHAVRVNRPREAVAALTRLDPERPPIRQNSWYASLLAQAYHQLGDHRTELAVATLGRRLHPDAVSPLWAETRALAALGKVDEVRRRLDEAVDLPGNSGDGPGDLMRDVGAELRAHGHEAAARDVFARALAWLGNRPPEERSGAAARRRRAVVLYDLGRWDEARALFERLATERPRDVDFRGYLGALAARHGDRARTLVADSALAALREPYLLGQHTFWRARIAALLGDRERAVTRLREALQQGRTYLDVHGEADFAALHDTPSFGELVRPKG
jgi:tetratricopeptide (TPR) repeat protein